jgi:hypothetical protein
VGRRGDVFVFRGWGEGSEGCLLFRLKKVPWKYLLNQGSQIFPKWWNIAVVGR